MELIALRQKVTGDMCNEEQIISEAVIYARQAYLQGLALKNEREELLLKSSVKVNQKKPRDN